MRSKTLCKVNPAKHSNITLNNPFTLHNIQSPHLTVQRSIAIYQWASFYQKLRILVLILILPTKKAELDQHPSLEDCYQSNLDKDFQSLFFSFQYQI